jgi:hypothetical protein
MKIKILDVYRILPIQKVVVPIPQKEWRKGKPMQNGAVFSDF